MNGYRHCERSAAIQVKKSGFATIFHTAVSRALLFTLHSSLFTLLVACGGPQATKTAGGEKSVFDISPEKLQSRTDTTVWIGKLKAGEIVQYDAWLRNTGEAPLVIVKVETSCGCTSAEYERKPIPPGGKGHFSFRYDSRGMWGMQLKMIDIYTSAAPKPFVLYVQAQVENDDFL